MPSITELTAATLDEEIQSSPLPVLVELWAAWCPPCRALAPVLDSLAADYGDRVRIVAVNTDQHPELALRFDVMSVPTLLVFDAGHLRGRLVGARSRARLLDELAGLLNW